MQGLHIIADFHQCACDTALLREADVLKRLSLSACETHGLTVVNHAFHQFGDPQHPHGATGAVVLAESHLALHTWPELYAVTLDIYVCNVHSNHDANARALYAALRAAFKPGTVDETTLRRGDLGKHMRARQPA